MGMQQKQGWMNGTCTGTGYDQTRTGSPTLLMRAGLRRDASADPPLHIGRHVRKHTGQKHNPVRMILSAVATGSKCTICNLRVVCLIPMVVDEQVRGQSIPV